MQKTSLREFFVTSIFASHRGRRQMRGEKIRSRWGGTLCLGNESREPRAPLAGRGDRGAEPYLIKKGERVWRLL